MTESSQHSPPRFFLIDAPRTCSQVFFKILASHPALAPLHHPFVSAAVYGPESINLSLRRSERAEQLRKDRNAKFIEMFKDVTYAKAAQDLENGIAKIEVDGKRVFVKEHAHFLLRPEVFQEHLHQGPDARQSITAQCIRLPSEVTNSLTPMFIIRHPALMIPSNWQTQITVTDWDIDGEDLPVWSSLQWIRLAFDFFQERSIS